MKVTFRKVGQPRKKDNSNQEVRKRRSGKRVVLGLLMRIRLMSP